MVKQIISGFLGAALLMPLLAQAQYSNNTKARVNRNESEISVISRSNQYRNTPDYSENGQQKWEVNQETWFSQQPTKHHNSRGGQHTMPTRLTQYQNTPNYAENGKHAWELRQEQWQDTQLTKTIETAPK